MSADPRLSHSEPVDPRLLADLEERWFAAEKPTWRPPRPSSRPPSAPPPPIGDEDADPWFV